MSADTKEDPGEDWETCHECGGEIEPGYVSELDGDKFHTYCVVECDECGGEFPESHTVTRSGWGGGTYCNGCHYTCDGCSAPWPTGETRMVGDFIACPDCVGYCEGCDAYYWGDDVFYHDRDGCTYCDSCFEERGTGDGIREYGHTCPDMWLGGPLPRNDAGEHVGYYVGFELEIGSDSNKGAMPVHEWARQNMEAGALDCKTDSSIEYGPYADGFEIATQPMTPEYFESVPWEGLMDTLEDLAPMEGQPEPTEHGLHVHIGRVAFRRDDVAIAMFCYLLAQDGQKHLTRIARRQPYHYCREVKKAASVAIVSRKPDSVQGQRLRSEGVYPGRDAINLGNDATIEIRSFRSTRNADELRDAVRVVYLAADYVMWLRSSGFVSPRSLHWSAFAAWVKEHHRAAYKSIRGPKATHNPKTRKTAA